MKYSILAVFLILAINHKVISQIDSGRIANNALYIEAAGVGGYGSINFDRVVHYNKTFMISLRSGISTYHIVDYTNTFNPDIIIPFTLNGSYGKNHKIELGIGETYSNIVQAETGSLKPTRASNFNTIFSIGYRYQKKSGGIVFRCAYTPIIEFNKYYRHWAGISVGYSF